jgi:hypothetical protein
MRVSSPLTRCRPRTRSNGSVVRRFSTGPLTAIIRTVARCAEPGCTVVLDAPGRCDEHGRTNWDRWRRSDEGLFRSRGYGSHWRRVRDRRLWDFPVCEYCGLAPSTEAHHVGHELPGEPGFYDYQRIRACCHRCHVIRSAEARRVRPAASPRSRTDGDRVDHRSTPATPRTPRERRPFFDTAVRPQGEGEHR